MTVPTSNIRMTDLNNVFGKGFSLSGYYGTTFDSGSAPTSGTISYSMFSGKSAAAAATTIPNIVGTLPLLIWLDGADQSSTSMTIVNGRVSEWKNKSGTVNYTGAIFSNTGYNGGGPTLTTNVGPTRTGPYFTGSNALKNSSVVLPSNYSIFAVANLITLNLISPVGPTYVPSYVIFAPAGNFAGLGFGVYPGSDRAFATFAGDGQSTWQSLTCNAPIKYIASTSTTASLLSCTNTGTVLTPYFDGVAQDAKTFAQGYASVTGMCVGDVQISNQPWNGGIGEIVIFSNVLSQTYRQKIEGYLAWKWGIQTNLPPGHPYLSSAPTNFN
jgi:hypothetical protein